MARRLDLLPKAHLHLHFTGAIRRSTLIELADAHGIGLPDAFGADWPPRLRGPTSAAGSGSSGCMTARGRCSAPTPTFAG